MCVFWVAVVGGGVRGVSRGETYFTAPHFSPTSLSPSILDDNSVLICIPKTLSDFSLPSRCERLENIDNYWQNPKPWATFHLEYCIYHFILLFAPFFLLMGARYWLQYLIVAAEAYMSRVQEVRSVGLLWQRLLLWMGGYCCYCLFVHISQWHRL